MDLSHYLRLYKHPTSKLQLGSSPFFASLSSFYIHFSSHTPSYDVYLLLSNNKRPKKVFKIDTKTEQNLLDSSRFINNWLEPGFEPGTSCIRSMNADQLHHSSQRLGFGKHKKHNTLQNFLIWKVLIS